MEPRPRSRAGALVVVAAAAVGLLLGLSLRASAQVPLPFESTTTTTAPPESTTTTAAPGPGPTAPPPPSTTTTAPPPGSAPPPGPPPPSGDPAAPPPGEQPPAEPLPPAEGDGVTPPSSGFPAELQAMMNSVVRSGPSNTRALIEALRPLEEMGMTPEQAAVVGFGRFPVAGYASYVHDWWFPRYGPGWRLHQGTDIFAPHGTPVRAPVDGRVRITNGGLGGLSVYVIMADGTYVYLTHLSGLAAGLAEGQQVRTGDVVGFVGTSGNARGGAPHLHIEFHPGGGPAVDPKRILDQFIADAVARSPHVVAAYAASRADAAPGAPLTVAPVEVALPELDLAPPPPPYSALLWASAVNPSGGALQLAENEAVRAAGTIDWDSRARAYELRRLVRELLEPVTPESLASLFRGP